MAKPAATELAQLKTAVNYLIGLLEEGSLVMQYDRATREELALVLCLLLEKVEGLPDGTPENLVRAAAVRAIIGAAEKNADSQRKDMAESLARHMREAETAASIQGHRLGEWEEVSAADMEYLATCRDCGSFVYVSHASIYDLLVEGCSRSQVLD
ncbi:MAG: hypothetical protein ACE5E7_03205 [Anaerolineae bacterium]